MLEEAKRGIIGKLGKSWNCSPFLKRLTGFTCGCQREPTVNVWSSFKKVQKKYGYVQIMTAHWAERTTRASGHYTKYSETHFQPIHTPAEDEETSEAHELSSSLRYTSRAPFI